MQAGRQNFRGILSNTRAVTWQASPFRDEGNTDGQFCGKGESLGVVRLSERERFVAGADVFSKQSDGSTVASQYAKLGISLRCANTDRVNGWLKSCIALATPGR